MGYLKRGHNIFGGISVRLVHQMKSVLMRISAFFCFFLAPAVYAFMVAPKFVIRHQQFRHSGRLQMSGIDQFDALLFDCDGVIAETERDVHRISFNEAFKTKGLGDEWSVEKYGELLRVGGGKERMTAYFDEVGWPSTVPETERKAFVQELHLLKTDNFNKVVESGKCQLRPGGTYARALSYSECEVILCPTCELFLTALPISAR